MAQASLVDEALSQLTRFCPPNDKHERDARAIFYFLKFLRANFSELLTTVTLRLHKEHNVVIAVKFAVSPWLTFLIVIAFVQKRWNKTFMKRIE